MCVHQHILDSMKASPDPRVTHSLTVITEFEASGEVEVLGAPHFDDNARPPWDYIWCLKTLQTKHCETHRHIMLLSGE